MGKEMTDEELLSHYENRLLLSSRLVISKILFLIYFQYYYDKIIEHKLMTGVGTAKQSGAIGLGTNISYNDLQKQLNLK